MSIIRFNPQVQYYYYEDFDTNSSDFTSVISGGGSAGSSINTTGDNHHYGVDELNTGTRTSDSVRYYANPFTIILGAGILIFETDINIPTLFDATNDGLIRVGIGNVITATTSDQDHTNGIYFEYNRATSNNWRTCTANAGTRTKTTTSTPVVANSFNSLKFVVNENASSVSFYYNNSLVSTHTTNITLNPVGINYYIKKLAGGVARTLQMDLVNVSNKFNISR